MGRNVGLMSKVCPGFRVKRAGTVPLTASLSYVKSKGRSSLDELLFFAPVWAKVMLRKLTAEKGTV